MGLKNVEDFYDDRFGGSDPGIVWINPTKKWVDGSISRLAKKGVISTDDPHYLILQEIGHLAHHQLGPTRYLAGGGKTPRDRKEATVLAHSFKERVRYLT
jgi:hypothetical protein